MFYLAAQTLQNLAEAEEIIQDIFTELWRRMEEVCITTCLSSYLAVSVKYKVINVLAKRNRLLRFQEHHSKQASLADYSTEQTLQLEELKRQLAKYTSSLPENSLNSLNESKSTHQLKRGENTWEGAYAAVNHLIQQGYKNIGIVTLDSAQPQMQQQLKGYEKAIAENGMKPHIKKIRFHDEPGKVIEEIVSFLGSKNRIDAVFFASNYLGIHGLQSLSGFVLPCPQI